MLQRIGAFLIDHIIGTLITGAAFFAVNWELFNSPTDANFDKSFNTFYAILAFGMIYYVVKDIHKGSSPGKKAIGLVVRDSENSGSIPKAHRLIIRNVTIFIWPVEFLLLLFTKRKLGDRLAGTQVIQLTKLSHEDRASSHMHP